MSLSSGARLGPYEILAPIAAGGMGEVYRARDTKLDRDVAIKVLPHLLAQDPERLARFEREAKVLASLNHPNIAQIYGLEENALVMELVEGETLKGPLPLEEALRLGAQIADALDAAHEKGITHRDLKPANIMVTREGVVKVLDFGLAAYSPDREGGESTVTMSPTRAGMILGTAPYMSPEQARGKPVDRRADIWAFGVVLWEMLTGRRLFQGETVSDILAAVLREEPDLEPVPAKVRRLLRKCLENDPKQRLQAIGDWRLLLEDAPRDTPVRHHNKLPWAVAAVFAVALGVTYFLRTPEPPRVLKLSVLPPEKGTFNGSSVPAVSPDGRRLAFAATVDGKTSLWVRDLDSLAARPLAGTEGAYNPFWSPDSRAIAFFAGAQLKKIDAAGGPVLTLCDVVNLSARGGSWSKDDVIVFTPSLTTGLFRVPAAGGSATALTEPDQASGENSHRWPWFLPDGRHFLYTARNDDPEKTTIYVGDLNSKTRLRVAPASSNVAYTPPGYLLFMRERTLMAQPFEAPKAQTTGAPIPVAEDVDYVALNIRGQFSSSQNGVLAYTSTSEGNKQLTWFDRSGRALGTVGAPGVMQPMPAIAPDGNTVAVARADPQTGVANLWLHDLLRGTASRFTFNPQGDGYPAWSPDGSHIAFRSVRRGVYQKSTNGANQEEVIETTQPSRYPSDWSRDGRYIFEDIIDSKTKSDVWVFPLFGDRKPFPYLHTEFNEDHAKLSSNGQWLAYESDEAKRNEVYVQTFPVPGGKWQVSTNGGSSPVWSRDGKELFFIGADQKMMEVEVREGPKFGLPVPLFDTRLSNAAFDVSKDGRFLLPAPAEQAAGLPITVVVNWTAGLKK